MKLRGDIGRLAIRRRLSLVFGVTGMMLLSTACGALKDAGKNIPQDRPVSTASLYGKWVGADSSLDLMADGHFEAAHLMSKVFSCIGQQSDGDVRTLTGSGSWTSGPEGETTAIYLKYSKEGCSSTFWTGVSHNGAVVWTALNNDDMVILGN